MTPTYILHSLRYFEPIREEFFSVQDAIGRAVEHLNSHFASPQRIVGPDNYKLSQEDIFNLWCLRTPPK